MSKKAKGFWKYPALLCVPVQIKSRGRILASGKAASLYCGWENCNYLNEQKICPEESFPGKANAAVG